MTTMLERGVDAPDVTSWYGAPRRGTWRHGKASSTSIAQAHLVHYRGFQAGRERRRRRRPDDLAAAARAHRPYRVSGSRGLLAGGDRAERVPAQPGGAQEGGARPRRRSNSIAPWRHGPEVDERLLADERDQTVRDAHVPAAPALAAAARDADGRPAGAPTPIYPTSSGFRWAASAPPGDDASPGSASYCRLREPSVSASTHWPPAVSTSG